MRTLNLTAYSLIHNSYIACTHVSAMRGQTSRTEENKGERSVRYGVRRLAQTRACIFSLHFCSPRKPSTNTVFPLGEGGGGVNYNRSVCVEEGRKPFNDMLFGKEHMCKCVRMGYVYDTRPL